MGQVKLMKGNEAFAEAAIRAGCDAYFGYPITPQSEVIEYLAAQEPHKRTGMVLLQSESEIAAINMVYGAAGTGKRALTSSSSPGISLKQEGISYLVGSELPCLILNVMRGGPGLGTIGPSQSDYFQATKGGGHGDYRVIVLAPSSVQEMADFAKLGFELAFKYRNPVLILSDGAIGQMMEKVELFEQQPRFTSFDQTWVTTGKTPDRVRNIITSLDLDPSKMELHNKKLQAKFRKMQDNEVRFERIDCDDAEYLIVAYGSCARICQKSVKLARQKGIKLGLLRPITLFPFPTEPIHELAESIKGILTVELSSGQMVEDVRLAVNGKTKVIFHGRMGGTTPSPDEVLAVLEQQLLNS
ncbi:MAG: 3-methyl-2-oxobutanoate dehydrogenase subunit VorB [Bacteroidetes bacterium RBG_13_46_8]|nr:MAG: 3-methyl-2-oxobutanoate dehydrogenase subunit VorB [Bacteroidetes bacterium RBG_13_46_8]